MNKDDRIVFTHLPAAVDHLLTTALHLGVITLYRGKIQILGRLAGGHGRSGTATQADVHRRAPQHNQLGADRDVPFLYVLTADITQTTGQHDRLVVTADLAAVVAGDPLFIGTEVTEDVRTAKFVVERRRAQRTVDHDVEGGDDAARLAKVGFPRLLIARDAQVGDTEAAQTGLRLGTPTGGTFVADFAA